MATRTVSNSGGNWNSVGTWVEGAVPTNADDVVFTATSGDIVVNVAAQAKSIDFTNYVNTISGSSTLNLSGNFTLVNTFTQGGTFTLTFLASSTITTNGTLWLRNTSIGNVSATLTLADDFSISGSFSTSGSPIINGNTLYLYGNFNVGNAGVMSGTTHIILCGTGTWQHTLNSGACVVSNNLTINTSGTITLGTPNPVRYNGGTLTYTAGTVITTSSTLTINGNTILDTGSVIWNNVMLGVNIGSFTLTINSTFRALNVTNQATSNITFDGTHGFDFNDVTLSNNSAQTHILKAGITYVINNSFTAILVPPNNRLIIRSSIPGTHTYLKFGYYSGSCNIGYVTFTDIDASGGRTITVFGGILNNTINIKSFNDYQIIGY